MQTRPIVSRLFYLTFLLTSLGICVGTPAAIVTFSGADSGVAAGGPRPNSDAALASFLAQAGSVPRSVSVIDFENQAVGLSFPRNVGGGVTVSSNGNLFPISCAGICDTDSTLDGYNTTRGGSKHLRIAARLPGESNIPGDVDITFTFAVPVDSFGLFITGRQGSGFIERGLVELLFNDGGLQIITPSTGTDDRGGVMFFGFTNLGAALTSVTFRDHGPFLPIDQSPRPLIGIDDIVFSRPVQIPEPASLALFALALASLGFSRRKQG